jgi:hypothetical protein
MEGRADPPPAAQLLGFRLVEINPDEGTIVVAFTATDQFLNPAGTVQGGFLARWRRPPPRLSGAQLESELPRCQIPITLPAGSEKLATVSSPSG